MSKTISIYITIIFFNLYPSNLLAQTEIELESKIEHFYYSNLDSMLFYANQLEDLVLQKNDLETIFWIKFYTLDASSYHFKKKENLQLLNEMGSFLIKEKKHLSKLNDFELMESTYNYMLGTYYYELNDFERSIETLQSNIKQLENNPNLKTDTYLLNVLTSSLNTLGNIYTNEERFDEANSYFEQSLTYLEGSSFAQQSDLYNTQFTYAKSLKDQGEYKRSNSLLLPSLEFMTKNNKENINRINLIASLISENYINLNKKDSSWYYIEFQEKNLTKDHPFNEDLWISKAKYFKLNKENSLAIEAYKKALPFSELKWNSTTHPEVANLNGKIAKLYVTENNTDSALLYLNKGIQQLKADPYSSNYHNLILLELLNEKTKILNSTEVISNFQESINLSKESIQLLDSIKNKFISNDDEIAFVENAYSTFNNGITALYKMKKQSELSELEVEDLFYLFEKSKATTLLSAFYNTKAYEIAGIPNELIEKERQLKTELTQIENQKSGIKVGQKEQLFILQKELNSLLKNLEANYPKYYQLKYSEEVISLTEVQKHLKKNEVAISYFYGETSIYAIAISQKENLSFKVPLSQDLKQTLNSYIQNINSSKSNLEGVLSDSRKIFYRLIAPITNQFNNVDQFVVLPDGLLNYIPFESLIQENGSYLIEDYSISYANSATLLYQHKAKNKKNNLLAYAPSFEKSNALNLSFLPNNENEVESISTSFSGKKYLNQDATKQQFIQEANSSSIYHFATHAIYDDEFPDRSFLAFSTTNENDNQLFVNEIYNLEMGNANMVTLSACETGVGDLKKGEGFISIARAFFYSGAKSITSTLWQINDASSTFIMSEYYKQLSKGKSKGKALQHAKLKFLKDNKETKLVHPYYWSSFIVSGNNEPLTRTFNWWLIGLASIAIPLILVVYKKITSAS